MAMVELWRVTYTQQGAYPECLDKEITPEEALFIARHSPDDDYLVCNAHGNLLKLVVRAGQIVDLLPGGDEDFRPEEAADRNAAAVAS